MASGTGTTVVVVVEVVDVVDEVVDVVGFGVTALSSSPPHPAATRTAARRTAETRPFREV